MAQCRLSITPFTPFILHVFPFLYSPWVTFFFRFICLGTSISYVMYVMYVMTITGFLADQLVLISNVSLGVRLSINALKAEKV